MDDLSDIVNDLKEARLYVRSDVDSAIYFIDRACQKLHNLTSVYPAVRLKDNLTVAKKHIQVDPDFARCYIDGAAIELLFALGKQKEDS